MFLLKYLFKKIVYANKTKFVLSVIQVTHDKYVD